MSDTSASQFRAVEHFGKSHITNELELGLKQFCDWSFLKIGAYANVSTGTSGVYGGSFSRLQVVNDPNYSGNTLYQGIRSNWIYETGVNYVYNTGTYNPYTVQVYVNGSGITTGTVGYTHYIDYPLGRVVFDSAQTNKIIRAQYAFRAVNTYLSSDKNWWYEVSFDSYNPADLQWAQNLTSGDFAVASSNRVQLPAIIIESTARSNSSPLELGTLVNKNQLDVLCHVMAETREERNNIVDILRLQKDKTIVLPDSTKLYTSGLLPLDERGMVVNNPVMYPEIIGNQDLIFRHARFVNTSITDVKTQHPKLHWSVVRLTMEIIF